MSLNVLLNFSFHDAHGEVIKLAGTLAKQTLRGILWEFCEGDARDRKFPKPGKKGSNCFEELNLAPRSLQE